MRAPLPVDEAVRLEALRAEAVLDSAPERAFDDIVQLAQLICEVPIALVTLVDENRQWFKARIGLLVTETPREQSFCAHALASREPLVIPDTRDDPRFADNPLVVSDPNIRSYVGVPIYVGDGCAVGTLCVIDTVPRKLTESQLAALGALARRVEVELRLRKQAVVTRQEGPASPRDGSDRAGARPSADAELRAGDLVGRRYKIDGLIGSGGMGRVYRAVDTTNDQRVALKFMAAMAVSSAEATERFVREAQALLRVQSVHVARLLDAGNLDGGAPYLVMEHLVGNDLSRERMPMSVARALSLAIEACEGVAAIHEAGVVHRDIKPGNLFLARRADDSTVLKVLDFGVSKLAAPVDKAATAHDGALTHEAALLGSPRYMSPDQLLSSRDVDTSTDIWALGVLVYELLTTKHPFEGTSITEICASIFTTEPRSMREHMPDIPAALDEVVLRCLRRDKAERWPSANALRDALAALL